MKQDGKYILMNREEFAKWLDEQPIQRKFQKIQQHHTYIPDYSNVKNNHIELMKSMDISHIARGMSEIAQHFSTFPDGLICTGRPLTKDGGGFLAPNNALSITLENVGNFDKEDMTEGQKKTILFINACLCKKFGVVPSTETLPYHAWFSSKTCPGVKFFGGNTKDAAEKYFIPLVKKEIVSMSKETEISIIVDGLKQKGYITESTYWYNVLSGKESVNIDYLKVLLTRVLAN